MKELKIISLFLLILCITSCKGIFRQNINVTVIDNVVDQNGKVHDYIIDPDKPKIISYFYNLSILKWVLDSTPTGKIDKIIEENPEFQFLFYYELHPTDTVNLVSLLKSYNCKFPVILDEHGLFVARNTNNLSPRGSSAITCISWICDKNGGVYEVAIIGTTRSFFDSSFNSVRRTILHKNKSLKSKK